MARLHGINVAAKEDHGLLSDLFDGSGERRFVSLSRNGGHSETHGLQSAVYSFYLYCSNNYL